MNPMHRETRAGIVLVTVLAFGTTRWMPAVAPPDSTGRTAKP